MDIHRKIRIYEKIRDYFQKEYEDAMDEADHHNYMSQFMIHRMIFEDVAKIHGYICKEFSNLANMRVYKLKREYFRR